MNDTDRKKHWENIYRTKDTQKVSWYQKEPQTSIQIIVNLDLPKTAKIIDAGCGDSYLPDFLIQKGYSDITLVDISKQALDKVKERLGENHITFVHADITSFTPTKEYDVWHDRAVFHFLNDETDIGNYTDTVSKCIKKHGFLIIGTFSNNGPDQCSGLVVRQYSEDQLFKHFENSFHKIRCFTENHTTPSGSSQNFLFCILQKK